MQYPATGTKPATDAAVRISYANPNHDLDDLTDLLYEVTHEIIDARLGHNLEVLHKYGGDLSDTALFIEENRLRNLADRVHEIRTALSEVG